MKKFLITVLLAAAGSTVFGAPAPSAPPQVAAARQVPAPQMPEFRFENFTTANGLPDNHVFAVLVDGDRIWAGTENGLATVGAYAVRATSTSGSITGTTTVNITVTAFTPPPSRSAATAGCTSDRTPGSRYGRPNGWLGVFVGWGYLGPRLLSHECRHVYRYEIHGSIAAFLPSYLQQVATVGYHDAPFERDARPHNLNG